MNETRRSKALSALVSEPSVEAAARASGLGRSFLFDLRRDASFRAELDKARAEAFTAGLAALKAAAGKAATTMVELLNSSNQNTRRLAATTILGLGLKVVEVEDFERRLSRLEEILEKGQNAR